MHTNTHTHTHTRSSSSSRLQQEYEQQQQQQQHYPPGFHSLSEYAISLRNTSGSAPPPGFFESENRQRHHHMKLELDGQCQERSSFVDLAAVLGEGLAESICDNIYKDDKHKQQQHGHGHGSSSILYDNDNSYYNEKQQHQQQHHDSNKQNHDMNNYQRQSRHSAARLIGSKLHSSSSSSPLDNDNNKQQFNSFLDEHEHGPNANDLIFNAHAHAHAHAQNNINNNINNTPSDIIIQQSRMSSVSSSPESLCDSMQEEDSENTAILAAVAILERELEAEEELSPFLRDVNVNVPSPSRNLQSSSSKTPVSRGLVILGVATLLSICSNISIQDIRSTCEAFGSIDVFRGDFAASRGVIFINYFDLRCAQYAAQELLGCLYRLAESEGVTSRSAIKLKLQYCTTFNSSSANDDSKIVLSNLPHSVDEDSLAVTMGSYGAVKAVHYQISGNDEDVVSYIVEFYDIQDARQALLELESMNPWSCHVTMEVGKRNPSKRRQGKDLLSVIAQWRHGGGDNTPVPTKPKMSYPHHAHHGGGGGVMPTLSVPKAISPGLSSLGASNHSYKSHYSSNSAPSRQQPQPVAPVPIHGKPQQVQLVLNPENGQYSYVIVNQDQRYAAPAAPAFQPVQSQYTQSVIMPQNGLSYPISVPVPTLGNVVVSDNISVASSVGNNSKKSRSNNLGNSNHSRKSTGTNDVVVDETNLALDISSVKRGLDKRTSLMVRNIPNKYTQQMLLAEFTQDGYGSHKIDFFYLPIDFKNKCNRGYAFINFTSFKDIVPFYKHYQNKSWKIFNSDKICNITYARIQGKQALVKRFEHSSVLMEKDEDYRPLVFKSFGVDKGQREVFPKC